LVVHVDDDFITLLRGDGRAGEHAVDGEHGLALAEPRVPSLLHLQNHTIDPCRW
jgi:hypothetical protein